MIKPIYLLILLLGSFPFQYEQQKNADPFSEITICHSNPDDMSQFVNSPGFASFHPSPLEIKFLGKGEMTTYPTSDGKTANGYLIKANGPSDKWLFVYQEWWGLNDHIKSKADEFYDDLEGKVNVIALDMYDGQVTSNPQEAGKLMQGAMEDRLIAIVKGAQELAGTNAKIANVGWCFGGAWSLRSALLTGEQNIGSVMYYGMPVRDVEQLKKLNSDVLGLFATEQYISEEIIMDFASKMN